MSNFDIRLVGPDDVEEEMSPYEKIDAAKEIYGWPFKRVRGIENLVNLFKKYLMTTYGSDPTDEHYGSYFRQMVGKSFSSLREIADDIQTEVKRVEEQIKTMQTESNFPIPDSERLKEIRLIKVYEVDDSTLWRVNAKYKIINREGDDYEGELLPEEG